MFSFTLLGALLQLLNSMGLGVTNDGDILTLKAKKLRDLVVLEYLCFSLYMTFLLGVSKITPNTLFYLSIIFMTKIRLCEYIFAHSPPFNFKIKQTILISFFSTFLINS
jgi:hypothetical protein